MKKLNPSIFTIILLVFFFIPAKSQVFDDQVFKMTQFLNYVNNYYVDTVDQEELVEEAIISVLKELDPHSVYVNKDEVQAMNEPLHGNFEGIGVHFNILNDTVLIINTIDDGPSEKAGIKAGDRIINVEGETIAGIGIKTKGVRDKLLGEKGTKVKVSILRRGSDELIDFTITRDKIPIYSVDASYMLSDSIGYIKLNRFSATTMKEFNDAMDKLEKQGMKHLVLDLADNGGGYLNVSIDLADEFLDGEKTIVYTEGKNRPKKIYKANTKGRFEDGKLIVLIDEGSASASEILSGAIQDWDRGIIIGRRSFGKGLVQQQFQLRDKSMIRLTVARYFTPTGRLIQKPYENGVKEYRKEIEQRRLHGELLSKDSIDFPDSLKFSTLINKRQVYGGGGIMPDVFIPVDTIKKTGFYKDLINNGFLNLFVLQYIDDNRKEITEKYPDFNTFKTAFQISDKMFDDLVTYASEKNVEAEDSIVEKSREDIEQYMTAIIAKDLWSLSEYYEIYNTQNPMVEKALEVINEQRDFEKLLGFFK